MNNKIVVILLSYILASCIIAPAFSQELTIEKKQIFVRGTSTLHDWESSVNEVTLTGVIELEDKSLESLNDIQVSIKSKSIKSTKGDLMDKKTHHALKSGQHPSITYKMKRANVDEKNSTVRMDGTLTIAGTSREVPLTLTYKVLSGQQISFKTSHEINLKDFKIKPPTAMMGTIRTGEKVTVSLDMVVHVEEIASDMSKNR